jgi:hypothetical protein
MTKRFLEDMVKSKHFRLENKKKEIPEKKKRENSGIKTKQFKKRSRYMLWLVAFFSTVFCLFALSFLFGRAEILVTPKTQDVVLNENLSAVKDSDIDGLSFHLMVVSDQESKNVEANGEKNVSESATGSVAIYNSFSSSPQLLAINTRLEGSNGKIYKTLTKITVPGMNKDGTPGKTEVKIYGSATGADYNSTPLDFTIIGFKGTSKYAKFKVRSEGEITGGLVGKIPVVSEADKALALADLNTTLKNKLMQKANDHNGFILFKDAIFINIDDSNISLTDNKDNSATLTESGTLDGILFDEQKLTQKIAKDNVDKYDGSDVYLPNIKDLIFTLVNQDSVSFNNLQNINFNLSGPAKIVWKVNENKFTADLLGKSKSDFSKILSQYPNINSATLTLSPFWKMSIPNKAKDIKVIVNYPQ